jgi:hypothetical protein
MSTLTGVVAQEFNMQIRELLKKMFLEERFCMISTLKKKLLNANFAMEAFCSPC